MMLYMQGQLGVQRALCLVALPCLACSFARVLRPSVLRVALGSARDLTCARPKILQHTLAKSACFLRRSPL